MPDSPTETRLESVRRELMEGYAMGYEWVAGVPRRDLDTFEDAVREDERARLIGVGGQKRAPLKRGAGQQVTR